MINVSCLARMRDDAINPYVDDPPEVRLTGIQRRMTGAGRLKRLDLVPSESSLVQGYGVSRDTARRAIALQRRGCCLHRASARNLRRPQD